MGSLRPAAATARASAASVVASVLVERRFLDTALAELRRKLGDNPLDWALVQELAYGTLRWYHELAGIAALFLARPLKTKDADLHALLLLGLYQLRHMRIVVHAAVDATVAAADVMHKPWGKSLLNACLRAYLREGSRVQSALAASAEMRYSHPAWMIAAVRRDHPAAWERVLDANNSRPPMVLRVNGARVTRADYIARLNDQGLRASAHPLADVAVVLEEPLPVERVPGFARGLVSVQDAAAQWAAIRLDARPGQRVLDACAAPGGKAAHILERAAVQLTALDRDPDRLARVRDNFARLGLGANLVAADATAPTTWWDGNPYDRILVDAPCSATGVIRRHPDIKLRRRPEDLPKLVQTQAQILDGVWPCLAPGGKLLYATCSLLAEENERQMQDFVARHADAATEPPGSGGMLIGRQILPGEEGMDGFYYASLCKN
jgi:16S rRNA (cytosine967-C5)-methyltransferase